MRERERGGEHKESARKVYNALKPARHSLLYIKPVNSLVNVPTVPRHTTKLSYSTEGERYLGLQAGRQTDSGSTSAGLDYCHPFCVAHIHAHTLT